MFLPTPTAAIPVIFVDGVLAGMFICSSLVEHAARALNAANWIAYKQAKEAVFGPVMPPVFLTGLVCTAAAAVVLPGRLPMAASALLLGFVFAVTLAVHLPLNKAFQGWAPAAYPVTWDQSRRRWRNWNLLRTALVTAAFGLVLVAQA